MLVCGIDEVGRGCLAGPVITAAVALFPKKHHKLLKDSKILTPKERQQAYSWIVKNSWYSFGAVDNRTIDKRNIWHATLLAMRKSLLNLLAICPRKISTVLIDAMPVSLEDSIHQGLDIFHFPFGESKSTSIAAASIIAKVKRDEMMARFDKIFPGYKLAKHKGYATKSHKQAITQQSHTIIHRLNFLKGNIPSDDDHNDQQTLC